MLVPSSLVRCLLLSCVLVLRELGGASDVEQESGSGFISDLEDVISSSTVEHVMVDFRTEWTEILRTSTLQATAEAHDELTSRLNQMQRSLETLPRLLSRLDVLEQAMNRIDKISATASACFQKITASICTEQGDGQQHEEAGPSVYRRRRGRPWNRVVSIRDFEPSREEFEKLERTVYQGFAATCAQDREPSDVLSSLSKTQREVQRVVHDQNNILEGLSGSLAALFSQQRDVQGSLADLPTRKYIHQNIALLSKRLDWTTTLEKLIEGQAEFVQTLSSQSARLGGLSASLTAVSDQQTEVQRSLSSQSERLAAAGSALAEVSERQQTVSEQQHELRQTLLERRQELQQTLSQQAARLAAVAEAVLLAPVPAGRPALLAGRLLGEPCRGDADCSSLRADTVCSSGGRCQCAPGLQPVAGGACRPHPRLSEPCRASSDCRGSTTRAVCARHRCACPRGLFSFNGTECRSGLGIGEPCSGDRDCSTLVGLTCRAGVCKLRNCDAPRSGAQQYRLVGGTSCSAGLLQFSFNAGQLWQFLCDSDWTQADAAVACRYLGFSGGAPLSWNITDVREDNFFSVKDYVCDGSESSLSRCRRVYGRKACAVSELAGVECSDSV